MLKDWLQHRLQVGGRGHAQGRLRLRCGQQHYPNRTGKNLFISIGLDGRRSANPLHAGRLTPYRKEKDEGMNDNLHHYAVLDAGPGLRRRGAPRLPLCRLRRSVRGGISRWDTRGPDRPNPGALKWLWRRGKARLRRWTTRRLAVPRLLPILDSFGQRRYAVRGQYAALSPAARVDGVGIDQIFAKHQGMNPTGSFKDTGMTAAMSVAKERGFAVGCLRIDGNTSQPWPLMRHMPECAAWC